MFRTIIRWLLVLTFSLLLILYLIFSPTYLAYATYKGRIIKIDRDRYGVATIHASSLEDYLYGMGTIAAEDRLFQMTLKAYALQGRLAQFVGEKSLDYDRFMRELNLKKWADLRTQRFKKENVTQYLRFEALSKGINDRVASMAVLPMQFYLTGIKWQNFTVNHLFYGAIQMEWGMAMNADDEFTRSSMLSNFTKQQIKWLLPNLKDTWAFKSLPIVADHQIPQRLRTQNIQNYLDKVRFDPLSVDRFVKLDIVQQYSTMDRIDATNSWAINGNFTETGLPIIVNDPHVQNSVPSTWYYIKLNYTRPNGQIYLGAGACNPGSSQFFGKHGYFASAYSVLHCDNQDLFRQKIQGNKYFVDGQWRDLKIRNQTILVKTSSGLKTEIYEVKQTHRGPIIHYIFSRMGSYMFKDDTISIAFTGFNDNWQTPIRMTHMMFADDLEQLRDHMQNGTSGFTNLNIVSITEDNHIIMQQGGMHPIRRNPQSGIFIKDGTKTVHDWVGVVPPQDRIHIVDPPKGYIINANNRLAESAYYGGYLDYTAYTARADRIDDLIRAEMAAGRKINAQFAKKILLDTVDVYCRQILPQILDVVPESRQLLASFDCDLTAESYQASVYQIFLYQVYNLMRPVNPEKMCVVAWHQMPQGIFNFIHFAYRGDEGKRKIMKNAWNKVKPFLAVRFNTEDVQKWKWGELHLDHSRHIVFRGHPTLSKIFNLKTLGKGNVHTCNMYRADLVEWGNFQSTLRAGLRAIYGYGQGFQDMYLIDHGISENILSAHYSDQWQLLKRNQLINLFGETEKNYQL